MIHSIDTFRLLKVVNTEGAKINRVIDCLIQFYIAREETKFGFSLEEAFEMFDSDDYKNLKYIRNIPES